MNLTEQKHHFHTDRRIILILIIFSVCVFGMVGVTYMTISTMGATRSYGTLKDNWRFLRMDATKNLIEYAHTRKPAYYELYNQEINVLKKYSQARKELMKPHYNYQFVVSAFGTKLKNISAIEDLPTMIKLFRLLRKHSVLSQIITLWNQGDQNLTDLDTLAIHLHERIQAGTLDQATLANSINKILLIDTQFNNMRNKLNFVTDKSSEWLKHTLWLTTLAIGLILLIIGAGSTTMVLRSSSRMRKTIEENEQRFQSLFDNNPNAVFLKNLKGQIVKCNEAATNLTEYSSDELMKMNLEQIIIPDHRPLVKDNFDKAAGGIAKPIEVNGVTRNGQNFTIELTNIPVYVNNKCTGVFGVADNITARKIQEKRIRDTLREKEILLSEIHHRVKNNLALINGLLDLQVLHADNPELSGILADAQRRVHSMAKVHEMLYRETSFSSINLKSYIHKLSENIANTFSRSHKGIVSEIDAEELQININKAIPIGLILNELITNVYKHAFEAGEDGAIFIILKNEGKQYTLSVLSDGLPLPSDFNPDNYKTMGMTLIRTLTTQIHAGLEVVHGEKEGIKIRFSPKDI